MGKGGTNTYGKPQEKKETPDFSIVSRFFLDKMDPFMVYLYHLMEN